MQVGDAIVEFLLAGDNDFGGGRWSGRAEIADEIADGEIRLMSDGADDGDEAGEDRSGERLIVEGGEIFDVTSTARDNNHIDIFRCVEKLDSAGNFEGGGFTLHLCGKDEDADRPVASAEDVEHVLDGGSAR